MLTTTFRLLHNAGACAERYKKLAKHLGGIRSYGRDKSIPLTEIADSLNLTDALWCLPYTEQPKDSEHLSQLLSAEFAEHVLHIFKKVYPDDDRPQKAIELARLFADGKIAVDVARAAEDAARAAGAATWAAEDAALAAGDAAREDGDAARAAGYAALAAGDAARAAGYAALAAGAATWAAEDAVWAAEAAAWAAEATTWAAEDAARTAGVAARAAERNWQLRLFKKIVG